MKRFVDGTRFDAMTAAERIEANYYERHWTVVLDPENYDQAEIDALVAAGRLEWRADVACIEGHVIYGAQTADEAEENRWRGAECWTCSDEERSDDPDDCTIRVRYVMTEAWRKELEAKNPWVCCEHCDGAGKVRRSASPNEDKS